MINKTENKNGYPRRNAQLKFPKANVALDIIGVVKKPFVKNSRQAFLETYNVMKPSSNRLLGSLNASDLSRLNLYLEPVTLSLGQSLYQPQDRIRYIYFPESAVISDLQMLEDGRTVEIAMTGKEGVTGLSSVFNSRTATNWTEVVVAGNALKLNAQILKQEFGCNNSLQTSLLDYVNSYIEQISQKVICNNYHQLKERFCSWLLMLQNRNGSDKFSLTHEQIARFLGVHRPGISHIANELREREIIDYRRGQIIILNGRELKNLTCSCFHSI
ncbi:MAG TPA: Crp/Fnr family transcriptional regulator [Pyrinomonadaceae bacterium]|nr:Crp/Fnr family transcriptional regulator [Pyrinomonadaceae bacterium]